MQQVTLKEYLRILRRKIQLRIAANVADVKQGAFNKRYYVLPDANNKLITLCRDDVKLLKRAGMMKQNVCHLDLMRECFYVTKLSLNDKPALSIEERKEKQKSWLKYAKKHRL